MRYPIQIISVYMYSDNPWVAIHRGPSQEKRNESIKFRGLTKESAFRLAFVARDTMIRGYGTVWPDGQGYTWLRKEAL